MRVWILYQDKVLQVDHGQWIVARGERGRYTNDLLNAAFHLAPWKDDKELDHQVRLLGTDLHALT